MGKPSNKAPSLHVIMDSHGNKLGSFTLHSVRRDPPPPPPGRRHANAAVPRKVYIVDPHGFRHLVQKLTGAPPAVSSARTTNLRDVAPPAIQLPATVAPLPEGLVGHDNKIKNVTNDWPLLPASSHIQPEKFEMPITGGYSLASPLPSPWFSNFPLLSPETLASLEQLEARM